MHSGSNFKAIVTLLGESGGHTKHAKHFLYVARREAWTVWFLSWDGARQHGQFIQPGYLACRALVLWAKCMLSRPAHISANLYCLYLYCCRPAWYVFKQIMPCPSGSHSGYMIYADWENWHSVWGNGKFINFLLDLVHNGQTVVVPCLWNFEQI